MFTLLIGLACCLCLSVTFIRFFHTFNSLPVKYTHVMDLSLLLPQETKITLREGALFLILPALLATGNFDIMGWSFAIGGFLPLLSRVCFLLSFASFLALPITPKQYPELIKTLESLAFNSLFWGCLLYPLGYIGLVLWVLLLLSFGKVSIKKHGKILTVYLQIGGIVATSLSLAIYLLFLYFG